MNSTYTQVQCCTSATVSPRQFHFGHCLCHLPHLGEKTIYLWRLQNWKRWVTIFSESLPAFTRIRSLFSIIYNIFQFLTTFHCWPLSVFVMGRHIAPTTGSFVCCESIRDLEKEKFSENSENLSSFLD